MTPSPKRRALNGVKHHTGRLLLTLMVLWYLLLAIKDRTNAYFNMKPRCIHT